MTRRRLIYLWVAILLLAVAAALMLYGEEPAPDRPEVAVSFPRMLRPEERVRMESRRTLPAPPPETGEVLAGPERPRDPVLAALSGGHGSAVVVEANAIRNSPVGKLLLDCLRAEAREDPFEKMKKESGVDLLQDLDRVALTEDGMIVSGHFGNARWGDLFGEHATSTRYGDGATLYHPVPREVALPDGGRTVRQAEEALATWSDQVLLLGESDEAVRGMIDRIEGRQAVEQPPLDESQTYGEIYGVLTAQDLARMFPGEQSDLAERFRAAADRIEIHVDTSRDVGIVADVRGSDPSQVEDLGKSLGAAMALARLGAQDDEQRDLADLLDLAKVRPNGDQFKVELAIPLEVLEKYLSRCGERRKEREERLRRMEETGEDR